ncbi:pyridoxamine 5'-phosphate oxidase [Halieaceae bacterium IMCC14734]|uniref:Pyridoxine/pyridoxamine 5'-phosphate oxidase n=1 Tax=Candidatus Litorirhabdus singularis TaxID=2518993 RepID=A0ABT3TK22_9GAMM|nr:pyridoxamine 5'-phosphate oxidase [Candidatus Litorirhabdus singularis]MCX2982660.1 pyridoxamine 5'-phosphate oxidase [Candidatus Litorirhabdus singularis]
MNIEDFRREYLLQGLKRSDLHDDPTEQFETWLAQAVSGGIADPTAMVLATVDANGRPWQRMVLLKDFGHQGFVFYTNSDSNKAQDIAANASVCLHFPWNVLERQVIVAGNAAKISNVETARYFLSRPRESQLAAWASAQSRPISARQVLLEKFAQMQEKFKQGEIPVPAFWSGYRVVPRELEFWQGGANRLHDRFRYLRNAKDGWDIRRLAP